MSANTDTIRYYVGDTSDLDGMSREEVETITFETDYEAEDAFRYLLDESYGYVQVAGFEYATSEILKEVDPVAWRVMLADEVAEVDLSDYPSEESDEEA